MQDRNDIYESKDWKKALIEDSKYRQIPILFNIHAGHVDPQIIVPLGGECVMKTKDGHLELFFNYGSKVPFSIQETRI